jgi:hypothetical protein
MGMLLYNACPFFHTTLLPIDIAASKKAPSADECTIICVFFLVSDSWGGISLCWCLTFLCHHLVIDETIHDSPIKCLSGREDLSGSQVLEDKMQWQEQQHSQWKDW